MSIVMIMAPAALLAALIEGPPWRRMHQKKQRRAQWEKRRARL